MELSTKQKLFYFFPVLFCFCLPFGSLLLSVIIVGWVLVSFFNLEKTRFRNILTHPVPFLMLLFFLLTLVSSLMSDDRKEAVFSVEVKMTFLIFPYLFFCFTWPIQIMKRCVVAFVSGCFFASVMLLFRAVFNAWNGENEFLFYTYFSGFIHASYFAMYLVLAIVFVLLLYPKWFSSQRSIIYSSWFFVAIFIAAIFFCGSKMGIISLFCCLPLVFLYLFRRKFGISKALLAVVCLGVLVFVMVKLTPSLFIRFDSLSPRSIETIDKTSTESTAVRVLIWQQCLDLIRENFWTGTGVADANNELYRKYEINGLEGAYRLNLNAHNQFFQTFIGMGLPGFLLLLGLTVFRFCSAFFSRKILLLVFSLLITLNFLVESMLQSSAGVLFFAFFICFFSLNDQRELSAGHAMNV